MDVSRAAALIPISTSPPARALYSDPCLSLLQLSSRVAAAASTTRAHPVFLSLDGHGCSTATHIRVCHRCPSRTDRRAGLPPSGTAGIATGLAPRRSTEGVGAHCGTSCDTRVARDRHARSLQMPAAIDRRIPRSNERRHGVQAMLTLSSYTFLTHHTIPVSLETSPA
ncbi:hypothetical protein B0H19DRAFT_1271102 [Mycena capillaripes]|nr:hypothetical protein B0H19DRAFT_1271102 [Mycena capillaripes]